MVACSVYRSVLSPSETTPGAANLLVIIEDRDPWEVLLTADNFGSRYLGPVQLGAAATYRSLFGINDAITMQMSSAPDSGEMLFGALKYEQPIGPYGTSFDVTVSKTFTDPGYNLDPFEVRGYSDYYALNVNHPFIRSRNENLNGHIKFDWRDVESKNNIPQNNEDRIRALRAGLDYEFLDRLLGLAVNNIGFEVSKGLDVFGSTDKGDANITRVLGDPEFTKIEVSVQRLQRVTNSVNFLIAGAGQLASNALLSSEEFSIGGINSVRGFDPSEYSGEDGVSGTMELQWNNPGNAQGGFVEKYQLYTFIDGGTVWNQDATTSNAKRESIAGAGLGVRVNFKDDLVAGAGIAFPLNRDVQTQGDDDPKAYFNLSKQF